MKKKNKNKIKALSLFANVGIAETYLKEVGIDVVLANEIDSQRVKFYNHLYPETYVINGDITEESISKEIIKKAKEFEVDLIMATPPCQGMSTAGKKLKDDERNYLIKYAVDIIENVKPKFVFLENVPEQLQTYISYNDKKILIPEYLKERLGKDYKFNESNIVNAQDYGVPQQRERAIFLLVRNDIEIAWNFPKHDKKIITFSNSIKMAESIGIGKVYTGKDNKKKSRISLDEFNSLDVGVINSSKKLIEGADIKGLSVAIMLGIDSSETRATQSRGRVIRFAPDKHALIFNLIINNTAETEWMKNSHKNSNYITITEQELDSVLKGNIPNQYTKKINELTFRF